MHVVERFAAAVGTWFAVIVLAAGGLALIVPDVFVGGAPHPMALGGDHAGGWE
jgi:hypothetical protein